MRITRRSKVVGGSAVGALALVVAGFLIPAKTQATPPTGVLGTPLVRGSFTDQVDVKFKVRLADHGGRFVARAPDASQIAFQGFTFEPGGSTGWHSHPGPVVVLVKSGALTYYRGAKSGACVGTVYPAGTAFVDSGNGGVHLARNESAVAVETSVVYFGVPEGESPRVDEPAPGNCQF